MKISKDCTWTTHLLENDESKRKQEEFYNSWLKDTKLERTEFIKAKTEIESLETYEFSENREERDPKFRVREPINQK